MPRPDVSKLTPMKSLERGVHRVGFTPLDPQCGFGAPIAKRNVATDLPLVTGASILAKPGSPGGFELREGLPPSVRRQVIQARASCVSLAMPFEVGDSHTEGRERASIGMEDQALNSEATRNEARVLSAGAPEDRHRVRAHVVPAADRYLLDRCGHVLDGNLQEAACYFDGSAFDAQRAERRRDLIKLRSRLTRVECKRKSIGCDASKAECHIGERQLAPVRLAVAKRSGVCASALRANRHPFPLELADRTSPRRDGMKLDHRRADSNPANLALEHPRHLAGVARYVGRCAAHVKSDHFGEP